MAELKSDIRFQVEPELSADAFVDILQRSTLAERRPVDDRTSIEGMLRNADLIVTARFDGRLVGIARAITDFSYCTYLSDLAVDTAYQRRGIGRELIRRTHEIAGLHTTLILLSAPKAETYYPHIGLTKHASCWIIRPVQAGRGPEWTGNLTADVIQSRALEDLPAPSMANENGQG